jgi:hypothetical protein
MFAASYAQARDCFLAAAGDAGATASVYLIPGTGPSGEPLATDVARLGPSDAKRVLLISSGCHGVEGFAGSAVQVALLRDTGFVDTASRAGIALVLAHALNPYGFARVRRVTEENVDLNRNFVDFNAPLAVNAAYAELAALIVPAHWPPPAEVEQALGRWIAGRGERAFQAALTAGQHSHPDGLFYAGRAPTASHQVLRRLLRDHAGAAASLGWIDVHTGLGPTGHGELIFAGRGDDAAALGRARQWWGAAVTSIDDGSSASAKVSGPMFLAAYQECPRAEYTGAALEFGTRPLPEMFAALRAEQWLHNHPHAPAGQAHDIRQQLREAFYVETPAWQDAVLVQGLDAARAALRGLAGG